MINKTDIIRYGNKALFTLKKYSPEILLTAGVAGVITGTVLACKATIKVDDILEKHNEVMDKIHKCSELPEDEYSEKDKQTDTIIAYKNVVVDFAKIYAIPAAVTTASLAAIIGSHCILSNRAAALAAAYSALNTSFARYRDAVKAKMPETEEEKIYDESTKKAADRPEPTCYDRFWEVGCSGWEDDPESSLLNLKMKQRHANELLKAKGHLFLNEVYDILGMRRTRAGQAVGWIYDPAKDDLQIDFGIYDPNRSNCAAFINGDEQNLLLHFNVQGPILYAIKEDE